MNDIKTMNQYGTEYLFFNVFEINTYSGKNKKRLYQSCILGLVAVKFSWSIGTERKIFTLRAIKFLGLVFSHPVGNLIIMGPVVINGGTKGKISGD